MTVSKNRFLVMIVFVCCNILAACTSYERQVVPFKMPESIPNAVSFDDAIIAARIFTETEAREAFGFDIMSAGIFPVQVSFDNKSEHSIIIIAEQTFLVDEESNVWPILDQSMAYDRLTKKTELGKVVPDVVKTGLLLGAAGAAIGAAAGLTVGGAHGTDNSEIKNINKEDLQSRSLQFRVIKKGELAYGFIFYPGEVKSAKVLRLQLRATDTGQIATFNMKLEK